MILRSGQLSGIFACPDLQRIVQMTTKRRACFFLLKNSCKGLEHKETQEITQTTFQKCLHRAHFTVRFMLSLLIKRTFSSNLGVRQGSLFFHSSTRNSCKLAWGVKEQSEYAAKRLSLKPILVVDFLLISHSPTCKKNGQKSRETERPGFSLEKGKRLEMPKTQGKTGNHPKPVAVQLLAHTYTYTCSMMQAYTSL